MVTTMMYKLAGRDEIICGSCLDQRPDEAEGAVALHPDLFPRVYRHLRCAICGSGCNCTAAVCGTRTCRALRAGFLEPSPRPWASTCASVPKAHWPRPVLPQNAPSTTPPFPVIPVPR